MLPFLFDAPTMATERGEKKESILVSRAIMLPSIFIYQHVYIILERRSVMWGFTIGRLFGIPVKLDVTFLLVLALALIGGVQVFLLIIILFGTVLYHEFVHSLVARHYGVRIEAITLFPLGGLSQMEEIPREYELRIAIVGPLSNLILAAVLYVAAMASGSAPTMTVTLDSLSYLDAFFSINLVLGAFNLVPAFPLDGGRIFRHLLAQRMDYTSATKMSVRIGQALALVLAFIGAIYNWFLILIAFFIFISGMGEMTLVSTKEALKGRTMADIMREMPPVLSPDDTVEDARAMMEDVKEHVVPVVSDGILVGIVHADDVSSVKPFLRESARVKDIYDDVPMTAQPASPADEIFQTIEQKRIDVVYVVEDSMPIGVVYKRDFELLTTLST
ncbi:CBS domain-containing protein [archaeon]|nr:MAG: CBS domain-containing protein [archaeon]